jgi:hypothetical protein
VKFVSGHSSSVLPLLPLAAGLLVFLGGQTQDGVRRGEIPS